MNEFEIGKHAVRRAFVFCSFPLRGGRLGWGCDFNDKQIMTSRRISPVTITRARSLRSAMTDVERMLWQAIRGKQLNSHRFRRQHPIGNYIVDFACLEQKIVIELDGGQHQEQFEYDEQRSIFLQAHGWQVLRFWNNDVLNNIDGVLSVIAENLTVAPPS